MARIRTVKPELFRHEELYALEKETGLPIRIAWVGLFGVCDREGRFRWKPNEIKLDVLPHDQVNFSKVLDALVKGGFLVHYAIGNREFGCIPTFALHQVINNKEKPSSLPSPSDPDARIIENFNACLTRASRVGHACPTPLFRDHGEGKGREGEKEGKGNGKGKDLPAKSRVTNASTNSETWKAYEGAYRERYKTDPVRNAKVNSNVSQLVHRLGEEAPDVARFYVRHNDAYYVRNLHPVGLLLKDAESLRTQWARGRAVTGGDAREIERKQGIFNAFAKHLEPEVPNGN
jgi:hypothetical protein